MKAEEKWARGTRDAGKRRAGTRDDAFHRERRRQPSAKEESCRPARGSQRSFRRCELQLPLLTARLCRSEKAKKRPKRTVLDGRAQSAASRPAQNQALRS
ncbi:hypothetical protein GN956_G20034 [Arapaima gigas]